MCSPATCHQCGKTTWTGCGLHVEQALRGVPAAEQCTCHGPAVEPSAEKGSRDGGLLARFRR